MEFFPAQYFDVFEKAIDFSVDDCFGALVAPHNGGFDFLLEVGAVYSSNIEGNPMDVNSFMRSKTSAEPKPKAYEEIVDLKEAYDFARTHPLTEENFLQAHKILSRLIVSEGNQGAYRTDKVGVFSDKGLVYMAVEHEHVPAEMQKLFSGVESLHTKKQSIVEALYYAALAHLHVAHIHPFADGNGRAARLLEKWLLAECVGERAWLVQSEKYYKEHIKQYYEHIALGPNYYEVSYERCVPFLTLLPQALKESCSAVVA